MSTTLAALLAKMKEGGKMQHWQLGLDAAVKGV
jgi:hypothetical protein